MQALHVFNGRDAARADESLCHIACTAKDASRRSCIVAMVSTWVSSASHATIPSPWEVKGYLADGALAVLGVHERFKHLMAHAGLRFALLCAVFICGLSLLAVSLHVGLHIVSPSPGNRLLGLVVGASALDDSLTVALITLSLLFKELLMEPWVSLNAGTGYFLSGRHAFMVLWVSSVASFLLLSVFWSAGVQPLPRKVGFPFFLRAFRFPLSSPFGFHHSSFLNDELAHFIEGRK
jgi:hypothetical protein